MKQNKKTAATRTDWIKGYRTKKIKVMFALLTAGALAFAAGCGTTSTATSSSTAASAASTADVVTISAEAVLAVQNAQASQSDAYSDRDLDASYDVNEAVLVDLASVTGDYTIASEGVYVFSGTLANGSIIVNAGEEDKVQIVLSGASITNSDGPAIYAVSADKVFVTAADGTINSLSDGSNYAGDSFGNSPDGAIFSRCDLTLNGTGTLSVNGSNQFGVVGKDDVVIANLTLKVIAASDGIVGKDSVSINGGTIDVTAGGDGIVSENDDDATLGSVLIDGGTLTITTGGASADSAKGIKAQSFVTINGGSIVIDAEDDAIHSASALTVTGGTIYLTSGDDGMHSDDLLVISGGDITVAGSYEGIEAGTITISDGTIDVTASDDGLNAAGGSDGTSAQGGRQMDAFASDASKAILISGGTVTVNADGDGIDSNGYFTMTGGTVYVSGPTDSRNGALDAGVSMTISGGVIIAAGASGMAQGFDQSSGQASLSYTYSATQQAGTSVTLKDASGNVIAAYTPEKAYQNVIISAPGLASGQTYTLYSGSASVESVTLTGVVTTVGSGGMSGGFDGGQNPGGGTRPGGGRRG